MSKTCQTVRKSKKFQKNYKKEKGFLKTTCVTITSLQTIESGIWKRNWKLLMLYFRARPCGAKYAFEAMRLITCAKALFTEKMAHRIVHGQFVNLRGGEGNNLANDVRMELEVKDNKALLKRMCGNKTLKAVTRGTSSAYGMKTTADMIDKETGVPPDSTMHTHKCTKETVKEMIGILQEQKPFQYQERQNPEVIPKYF